MKSSKAPFVGPNNFPLLENQKKMYTDGAVKADLGIATVGGVMRDRNG
ncbi:hypothetical protein Gotri_011588, partial [Gossypium trilobum]|nr:hypothetical protein [Gossypium trilobum]